MGPFRDASRTIRRRGGIQMSSTKRWSQGLPRHLGCPSCPRAPLRPRVRGGGPSCVEPFRVVTRRAVPRRAVPAAPFCAVTCLRLRRAVCRVAPGCAGLCCHCTLATGLPGLHLGRWPGQATRRVTYARSSVYKPLDRRTWRGCSIGGRSRVSGCSPSRGDGSSVRGTWMHERSPFPNVVISQGRETVV